MHAHRNVSCLTELPWVLIELGIGGDVDYLASLGAERGRCGDGNDSQSPQVTVHPDPFTNGNRL